MKIQHSEQIVGIIPVCDKKRFNFEWHDALLPIFDNQYLIRHAIYECALFGCDQIYVVVEPEYQNLIEKVSGFSILNPKYEKLKMIDPFSRRKIIPIYYIPINYQDYEKRKTILWSILFGIKYAQINAQNISRYLNPALYFIKSPYVVHDFSFYENCYRNNFISFFNNEFFQTDYLSSFCLTFDEFSYFYNKFIELESEQQKLKDFSKDSIFESKFVGNDITFQHLKTELSLKNKKIINLDFSYDIKNWSEYTKFIGGVHNSLFQYKSKYFFKHDLKSIIIENL